MATEVLINDGGAPARIIPYIAGSTISAGDPLQVGTDGEVDACFTTSGSMLGVALTAATSGSSSKRHNWSWSRSKRSMQWFSRWR